MADQVGCQSGSKLSLHSHLNISQGGILNAYSRDGAYRETWSGAAAVTISNDAARVMTGTIGWERIKRIIVNTIGIDGFQKGSMTMRFDMQTNTAPNAVSAQICINHNGVETWSIVFTDATGGYVQKTHVFTGTLYEGDEVQIWVDDNGGDGVSIRNFRLSFGWRIPYFGDGTENVLTTPLPLNDTDNPFTTTNSDP